MRTPSAGVPARRRLRARRLTAVGASVVAAAALGAAAAVAAPSDHRVSGVPTTSTPAPPPAVAAVPGDTRAAKIHSVLLVGSDEATGRPGRRSDTMILLLVDEASGRSAMISIPRNLYRLRWPAASPMAAAYPNGFDDLTNAVMRAVEANSAWSAYYDRFGDGLPGMHGLLDGLANSFQVSIDDYLMVNSCSFVKLIEAVGGVTVTVDKNLPLTDSAFDCAHIPDPGSVGPGTVKLTPELAWGYARVRHPDSDYHRMARGRQLLRAALEQVDYASFVAKWPTVVELVRNDVKTSLSADQALGLLVKIRGSGVSPTGLGLIPPVLTPGSPDFAAAGALIGQIEDALIAGTAMPPEAIDQSKPIEHPDLPPGSTTVTPTTVKS